MFCFFIIHQNHGLLSSKNFEAGIIVLTILLPLTLIFILVLRCKRKSMCCGVALSNVQHFDINEWDVIEEQEKEQDQEIEMGEIFAS